MLTKARGNLSNMEYEEGTSEGTVAADGILTTLPVTFTTDAPAPPADAEIESCCARITTTFSGAAVSSAILGDAGDTDRWSSNIALTAGTLLQRRTAARPAQSAAVYAPIITLDQAATAGAARVYVYWHRWVFRG